jgi:hypothetical protein
MPIGVRAAKRGLPPIPAVGIGWLYPVCPYTDACEDHPEPGRRRLIRQARELTGIQEKTALIHAALRELISRGAARRLVALGGNIIRQGEREILGKWGSVNYRDAFMKTRQLRFAFTVTWLPWV